VPPEARFCCGLLLDANRLGDGQKMNPNEFDNRSLCFTTDFPSALFLSVHGNQGMLLVQKNRLEPQKDIAHILCRWQEGGLTLTRRRMTIPGPPEPFEVAGPSWYGAMFQRALAGLGPRRSGATGFGLWVGDSSAGG
jgi:hypothetical protein